MFKTEEIENWNTHFLNGKIQENDLKHPTELFVVRTLLAFLEKLGYKPEPPFSLAVESENTREKRLFLIHLAKTIDRILKYTDKSNSCFYFDIIRPAPKRTAHMLEILLNYYYFYKMFVDEVLKIELEGFKQRGELIRNIDKLSTDNQKRRELALQMKDEIKKLSVMLPSTAREVENYKLKTNQIKENILQTKTTIEQLQQKLSDLQAREQFLKGQMVNVEEVSALKNEIEELQNHINELDSQEQTVQVDFNDCIYQLGKTEKWFTSVEEISQQTFAELVDEYGESLTKLKENEKLHVSLKHEVKMLQNTIQKMSLDITNVTEQLKSKKQNFQQETRDQLDLLTESQKQFAKGKSLLNDLKVELQEVESLCNEEMEIYENILKAKEQLLASNLIAQKHIF